MPTDSNVTTTTPRETAAPAQPRGLKIRRVFSTAGRHPYDEIEWRRQTIVQTNWKTGQEFFRQDGVEFPASWSLNAATIVTTKYFRGALGSAERENSLRQLIDRVVTRYVEAGRQGGYFASDDDAAVFGAELTWLLVHQYFSFNSPVWFNVGTDAPQQVSACFILSVEDTMDSILDWYRQEGIIFKGGSGAGVNLSRIRGSQELLTSGGTASGPVSFMRGADASAGTIKSGGATRRAAKMVILDVDHPDIRQFIRSKADEERKIRVLRDAGFDMALDGKDISSVQYQNANNSVRVTDAFLAAVTQDRDFPLTARVDGKTVETVSARELFHTIAEAAWACGDPGLQYDDTINRWHTTPESGRINGSNPCSEYMSLDNSSCNLASLNLLAFLDPDGVFDVDAFTHAVELITTAMDISISFADFPTEAIGRTSRDFRQIGIGYSNLGAVLMACGYGYDSDAGRSLAAAITSLMTAATYRRSAELAGIIGPYRGYADNARAHEHVIALHQEAHSRIPVQDENAVAIHDRATAEWHRARAIGRVSGWRNAQASLLAPTGTISFMMDCDTTGIEPDFALTKVKKLVDGSSLRLLNQTIPRALRRLGYPDAAIAAILDHIGRNGDVIGAPGLRVEDYAVFDCAAGPRPISPLGHVRMMAAVQPFLSGAISKTVNLPASASVADVESIFLEGWRLGLKAVAVYRDNCKVGQPLSAAAGGGTAAGRQPQVPAAVRPVRRHLPRTRASRTTAFTVGGARGYLTMGSYPDGELGEIFVRLGKQGSTLAGIIDAFSIAVSIGLQYGVPLHTYIRKFTGMRFEPSGMTDDPEIRIAQSLIDYIARRLALDRLPAGEREDLNVFSSAERIARLDQTDDTAGTEDGERPREAGPGRTDAVQPGAAVSTAGPGGRPAADLPLCLSCGIAMRPSGSCYVCENCGTTSGCS